MWLWQYKNIHKKHLLWVKLFSFCLIIHLIFLLWILCIYRDNSYILSLSLHKHKDYSQPIIFVPYQTQPSTKPLQQNNKPTPVVKKNNATTTSNTPLTEKKITTNAKTTTITHTPEKKIEPLKAIESIKTIEPLEIAEPIKTTEPIKITDSIEKKGTEKTIIPAIPNNAQISHNYREVEALRRGAQLQKELIQKWKPPVGVSSTCICEISFFVNKNGIIEQLKMIKNSGVMMYDISARQALFAMKMPQWTYGKSLIISFKQ